ALAVMGEVLVQAKPRKAPAQQARERRLARLQRLAPQVFAIQLQEGGSGEGDVLPRRAAAQPPRHRKARLSASQRPAVNQARADLEPVNGLDDERIAWCPIVPVPG